jgi:hypothetical protein
MGQSLSLGQGQCLGMYLTHETRTNPYGVWVKQALKAFRKFKHDGRIYYTCNVARLMECDRLGEAKEVSLWKTHFFLSAPYFDDVSGAIFSQAPGEELARVSRAHQVLLYIRQSDTTMMDVRNGVMIQLQDRLVFASEKVLLA